MLPQKAIDEFKKMYFEDYGVTLSNEKAVEKANLLFNCLESIFFIDKEIDGCNDEKR